MRKDFGLNESEVNQIIDKRFGSLKQAEDETLLNHQYEGLLPGQRQISSKLLSKDTLNLATLLEKYEEV